MLRSSIASANTSETPFPLNNLPYASFTPKSEHDATTTTTGTGADATPARHLCVAIGDYILDLYHLSQNLPDLLPSHPQLPTAVAARVLSAPTLNPLLALDEPAWAALRVSLQNLLREHAPQASHLVPPLLVHKQHVQSFHVPAHIGDYTDFYSSLSHARNVGTMFRGPDNALPPNWRSMPIAYHGRASSVVVSGTPVRRPRGQLLVDAAPVFRPAALLDFELEVAAVIGAAENHLGDPVSIRHAGARVFGLCLMNDWSARDVQKWEYVPLGPFAAKNFATSVSPWVVTLHALDPFVVPPPVQLPPVLPYLQPPADETLRAHCLWDVQLEVAVRVSDEAPSVVCKSNMKNLYWTLAQQIAHHTVTGCNMRPGDLIASGTISGEDESSFGSMLELSWKGSKKVPLQNCKTPTTRTFLQDGDTVYIRGAAKGDGYTIGFGECIGRILPAHQDPQ